ncbi:sugar ABC transporter permease [Chelativorans sp.]|uniref:carbohydrate ABC transporter permease n=1 Tax=Chelativorans sp. TaxID=2203393 RepID=UPI0028111432|nr:sugar ABC transporter permease [Chelativorans sp.]
MTITATASSSLAERRETVTGRREAWAAYLFLAPFLLVYLVFLVYPLFKGFWISLHDWELVGSYREYIGFLNYEDLWYDPIFWLTVRNTLTFVALTVPAMTVLSLALALGVSRRTRTHGILRGIFFASSVFSVSVVTLIWQMVLNGERGLIAHLLRSLGIAPIDFLGHPFWAMPSMVVATLWWSVGLPMALFIAGLQQIPGELYEAAELDNASRWTVLRKITLPAIHRTVILVIVLQIVLQFQVFGQALLMTQGGPADRTRTLVQNIYHTAFRDWQVGYASAMAMLLFVLMFFVSMLQLYIGRRED